IALARLLHLPPVTAPVAGTLLVLILAGSTASIAGWRPRLAGTVVALAYWVWMLYSNSYGYVAHDHMALMVATAVLPTVASPPRTGPDGAVPGADGNAPHDPGGGSTPFPGGDAAHGPSADP